MYMRFIIEHNTINNVVWWLSTVYSLNLNEARCTSKMTQAALPLWNLDGDELYEDLFFQRALDLRRFLHHYTLPERLKYNVCRIKLCKI